LPLGEFGLIPQLFGEIHIPPAVWTEVVEQGGGFPVRAAALQAIAEAWLRVTPLQRSREPITAERKLHFGEAEVIQLAEELAADIVLIDDRVAVVQARAQGFRVVPTIAVYIEAKRRGLIGSVKEKVDQLRAARFRLTERDYRAILAAAGEL
jgi:predicted nucleic acid-binding protein